MVEVTARILHLLRQFRQLWGELGLQTKIRIKSTEKCFKKIIIIKRQLSYASNTLSAYENIPCPLFALNSSRFSKMDSILPTALRFPVNVNNTWALL